MGGKKHNNAPKKVRILTIKEAILYSVGIMGIQTMIGYINSYQSQFYTSIFGAKLMICAVIILAAKIISSFADPIIGNIIDGSHFKSGKMKPFVKMSFLPLAALTTLMFIKINFPSDFVMYLYITITTILWNISMSFADIPSQGMLAVLSPDSDEKSVTAGFSNALKSLGLVIPNGVIPVVCVLTKSPNGAITKKEYLISALFIAAFSGLCCLLMLFTTKERVKSAPNKMDMKALFHELGSNKMILIVFLIYLLGFGRNIAVSIGVQAAAVVFDTLTFKIGTFTLVLSGENLPIAIGLGSAVTASLSVILAPVITQKLGAKKTYLIFGVYGTIISTVCYLMFFMSGDKFSFFRSFWGIFIYQFVIGFMFGTHFYIPLAMTSDIVDYREMQTGKRTEGLQYAVLSLAIKLSNALSVATGIFFVGASGYVGTMTYSQVTPHMQNIVMMAYWLIPGICTGLSCIPVLFYKIDGPVKEQIKAFIAAKGSAEEAKKAE